MRTRRKALSAIVLWLALGAAAARAQPANDDCANATLIASVPFNDSVDTTDATTAPDDPLVGCDTSFGSTGQRSVWYRYVAAAPVLLEVSTLGSDYGTLLTAFAGTCGALVPRFCNDDPDDALVAPTETSRMLVTLGAGEEVYIEVVEHEDPSGTALELSVVETPVFQANDYPVSSGRPNAAANSAGDFLVAWIDADVGVAGRMFDAAGHPQGPTFQVSTATSAFGYYDGPSVAGDGGSGFIVAWTDGDGASLARKVDGAGTPTGSEIALGPTGSTDEPHVATDAAGNFAVAWTSDGPDGVIARRFDAAGTPLGPIFQVATGDARWARIAMTPTGEFVVVWTDQEYLDGDGYGVMARRYDASGAAFGLPFVVNVNTADGQGHYGADVTSLPDGGFVVVWNDRSYDYSQQFDQYYAVLGRRFDASGVGGTPFLVSSGTAYTYYGSERGETNTHPTISSDPDGNFVVVWNREYAGPYGQRFRANGTPVGAVFRASNVSDAYQYQADVAANASGDFVVVWDYGWYSSDYNVLGHAFAGPIAPPICPATPEPGCREPTIALKGSLRVKDRVPDKADAFTWKWVRGEAVELAALGDPLSATSYRVCIWDGASEIVTDAEVPPGGTCGVKPCWTSLGADGFRYVDKAGTRDGMQKLILRTGAAGEAKLIAKGKGPGLELHALPLTLPVTAQVLASNGECWSAVFEGGGVALNTATDFKAKPSLGTP